MLPIISYNGTCRFPVRERAFLLMETSVSDIGNARFQNKNDVYWF